MRISEGQARTLAEAKELNLALPLNDGSKLNVTELGNSDNNNSGNNNSSVSNGAAYLGKLSDYPNIINKGEIALVNNNLIIGNGEADVSKLRFFRGLNMVNSSIVDTDVYINGIDIYDESHNITSYDLTYKNLTTEETNTFLQICNDYQVQVVNMIGCEINGYSAAFVIIRGGYSVILVSDNFSEMFNTSENINALIAILFNTDNSHISTILSNIQDVENHTNVLNYILTNTTSLYFDTDDYTELNKLIAISDINYDEINTDTFIKTNQITNIDNIPIIETSVASKVKIHDNENNQYNVSFLKNALNYEFNGIPSNAIRITYYNDWTKIQVPDFTEIENDESVDSYIVTDGLDEESSELKLGPAIVIEVDTIIDSARLYSYQIAFAYKNKIDEETYDNSIGVFGFDNTNVYDNESVLRINNGGKLIISSSNYPIMFINMGKSINTELVTKDNLIHYDKYIKTFIKGKLFSIISGLTTVDETYNTNIFIEQDISFSKTVNDTYYPMYGLYYDDDYSNLLYYKNNVYMNLLNALDTKYNTVSGGTNEISAYDRELHKLKANVSTYLLKVKTLNYTYRFLLLDLTNYTPDLTDIDSDTVLYSLLSTIDNHLSYINTDSTEDGYNKTTTLVLPYIKYDITNDELITSDNDSILTVHDYNGTNLSIITKDYISNGYIYGIDVFTKNN